MRGGPAEQMNIRGGGAVGWGVACLLLLQQQLEGWGPACEC
jgi:hypothetical protein